MIIEMPFNLDLVSSLQFAQYLESLEVKDHEIIFDYTNVKKFRPFGMLFIASKIREFRNNNPNINFSNINFEHHTYAAHMGYFKCINLKYGKKPGEADGNSNYVPITYIDIHKLRKEAGERRLPIPEYIERVFDPLSVILSRNNAKVQELFLFAIREIVRNIDEHGDADGVWFAGQYWPSYGLVEISILDEGIGVEKSLSRSGFYKIEDDEEALLLSLQPGISRAFKGKQRSNDTYDNSGYGLFMTSQLCGHGGRFAICSGKASIILSRNKVYKHETAFKGTAVQMQLRVSEINRMENILFEIGKKGKKLSNINKGFLNPSKSSLLNALK